MAEFHVDVDAYKQGLARGRFREITRLLREGIPPDCLDELWREIRKMQYERLPKPGQDMDEVMRKSTDSQRRIGPTASSANGKARPLRF